MTDEFIKGKGRHQFATTGGPLGAVTKLVDELLKAGTAARGDRGKWEAAYSEIERLILEIVSRGDPPEFFNIDAAAMFAIIGAYGSRKFADKLKLVAVQEPLPADLDLRASALASFFTALVAGPVNDNPPNDFGPAEGRA